jgi:hypothetical protein
LLIVMATWQLLSKNRSENITLTPSFTKTPILWQVSSSSKTSYVFGCFK